tara:strand:- start:121 stop:300 length:180 start_codon:yes stop_codon:yes gene_type:complete
MQKSPYLSSTMSKHNSITYIDDDAPLRILKTAHKELQQQPLLAYQDIIHKGKKALQIKM